MCQWSRPSGETVEASSPYTDTCYNVEQSLGRVVLRPVSPAPNILPSDQALFGWDQILHLKMFNWQLVFVKRQYFIRIVTLGACKCRENTNYTGSVSPEANENRGKQKIEGRQASNIKPQPGF